MSKPIKFRAWSREEKQMVEISEMYFMGNGNLIELWVLGDESYTCHPDCIELMQYMNIKDINDVESCEGNYLTKEGYWPFYIEWVNECGCLMAVPVNRVQRNNWKARPVRDLLDSGYVNNGNIHENPELLKEGI